MKRILVLLLTLLSLCGVASASDSSDLVRAQRAVTGMLDAIDGEPVPTYKELRRNLAAQFQLMWGESDYAAMRKQTAEKYGRLMDYSFRAFERLEDFDRLMYIGSFTRERRVLIIFVLDREGNITAYRLTPYKPKPKNQTR